MNRYFTIISLLFLFTTAGYCGLRQGWNTPISLELGYTMGKGAYIGLGLVAIEEMGTTKHYFEDQVAENGIGSEYTAWQYRGVSAVYNHYFKNSNNLKINGFWGYGKFKHVSTLLNIGLSTDMKTYEPLVRINFIGDLEIGLGYEMIYANQRFKKSFSSMILLGPMGGLGLGGMMSGGSMSLGL